MKEFLVKKKGWLLIPLLIIIVAVVWYVSSTQWTRDFDLRYVEYVNKGTLTESSDYSYSLYEITNNTNRTLKDVSVVILVDNYYGDFTYEDSVSYRIKPGETVEYRLYAKDYKSEANARGVDLFLCSIEIVEIKYSR